MREALVRRHGTTYFHKKCLEQTTVDGRFIFSSPESTDKSFSIELCPGKNFNEGLLPKLGLNFCSVTWRSPTAKELKHVEETPAVQLAKRLSCQGYNVLLHLAGRNLRSVQVLNVLNVVKRIGVRNIFALQGGSYFSIIIKKYDITILILDKFLKM